MTLLNIRKFISLDQAAAYAVIYEVLILRREPFAAAVAILSDIDPKRDHSAVKKVLDALNQRFEDVYQFPLLQRLEGDAWTATTIGDIVYLFCAQISMQISQLEEELSDFVQTNLVAAIFIRPTLTGFARDPLKRADDAHLSIELNKRFLRDETFSKLLSTNEFDVLFDELFQSDKVLIDRSRHLYFQGPNEPIVLAIPKQYADDLIAKGVIIGGAEGIGLDVASIPTLKVYLLRQAFSLRAAAQLSGAPMEGSSFTDPSNITEIIRQFGNKIAIVEPSIDQLSISLNAKHQYAILASSDQIDEIIAKSGIEHQKVRILKRGVAQYYNPAIIYRRQFTTTDKGTGDAATLIQILSKDILRYSGNKLLHISDVQMDYSKSAFACGRCGSRVEYVASDDDAVVYAPCSHCLSVNSYDTRLDTVSLISSSKAIVYTDDIFEEVMHCPTPNCGNTFTPELKTTTKDREFSYCDHCHTIFQSQSATQIVEHHRCPDHRSCSVHHRFRVSVAKPVDTIACYNSMHLISYDSKEHICTVGERIEPLPVFVKSKDEIKRSMKFTCPAFGCSDSRLRAIVKNKDGNAFTKCKTCGTDIQVKIEK
jgi:hypothetical protein